MQSLIDLHLDTVEEPTLVEPGEYELKITSAQVVPSKSSSRDLITVVCSIQDQEQAQPVYLNMSIPIDTDPESTVYFMKLNLKRFFKAFNIDPTNPGNPPDWVGLLAWGYVIHKENKENGRVSHDVSKWIVDSDN